MLKILPVILCLVVLSFAIAHAEDATPAVVEGYMGDVMEPSFSADGRLLLFNNNETRAPEKDIFWARRLENNRFKFAGRLQYANSEKVDGTPVLDMASNIYFISVRNYGPKNTSTIYTGRLDAANGKIANLKVIPGLGGAPGFIDMDVEVSNDGNALYISRGDFRKGAPPRSSRLIRAIKKDGVWSVDPKSDFYFGAINKDNLVYAAEPTANELAVYYTRANIKKVSFEIMKATRENKDQPFGNLQTVYTGKGIIEGPAISADGRRLYFHMQKPGDKKAGLYSIPIK